MILRGIFDCPFDCFDWSPAEIRFDFFIVIWSGLHRLRLHWYTDVVDIFGVDIEIGEVVGVPLVAHTDGRRVKIKVFSPIFMVKYFNIIFAVARFFSK